MEKKTKLNLDMFNGVNYFTGLDRDNLVVDGDTAPYVPADIKILWFRSVNAKGTIKTQMVGSLEEIARHRMCVFSAEVYDSDNKMLAMGYGSASADEDGFIGSAERRAVSKALSHAGFTWHNGDFAMDVDVAQTQLNLYNSYINNGTLDITDARVQQLYEDALVTVLPDEYGSNKGKSIAAMEQQNMADIAKAYGISNSGDVLVNAKIKFVYMYQTIEKELQKKPEPEVATIEDVAEETPVKTDKPKKGKRGGRKAKDTNKPEPEIAAETEAKEVVLDATEETGIVETMVSDDMPEKTTSDETVMDDTAVPETVSGVFDMYVDDAEMESIFNMDALDSEENGTEEFSEEMLNSVEENGFHIDDEAGISPFEEDDEAFEGMVEENDDSINSDVFDVGEETIEDNDDFDIQTDFAREENKMRILNSWGYKNETDLTTNWKAHLDKVREKYITLTRGGASEAKIKEFIENIPIFDNFLWKDKANQNAVVLLGDFMNENEAAVRHIVKNGISIPANTVKAYMEWYINHVWDEF